MSYAYIKRITVKADGVYICSRMSNDDRPFRSWKSESLSKVYADEGQSGLDREIIGMLSEYARLSGSHKSLARYHYAYESTRARDLHMLFINRTNERYASLDQADRDSLWGNPTPKAKEYQQFVREMCIQKYADIAKLCEEYDKIKEEDE